MAKNERILYEEPAAIAMQLAGRAHLKKKQSSPPRKYTRNYTLLLGGGTG
jgi:hypothetical protein